MPRNTTRDRASRVGRRAAVLTGLTAALSLAALAAAPAAVAAPPVLGAVTVTAPASVDAGDTFEVQIGLDGVDDLYAYELSVTFDPDLVQYVADSEALPSGGYDSVTVDETGTVTLRHTRLGTSPGLTSAQTLATMSFTAQETGGDAALTLGDALFLSSTSESVTIQTPVSATTTVIAAVEPSPSPTPSTESPSPSPSPTAPVTGEVAGSGGSGDPLAVTGADATIWIAAAAVGAAAIAIGAVVVIRRRREVTE